MSTFNELLEKVHDINYDKKISYYTEKKTTEEYRLSKFKKEYKYNPEKKTIIVNGEEFKIDLDVKNPTMKVKDLNGDTVSTVRQTSAALNSSDDPIIFLDRDFFKLKNKKRMDALLQHEIGHQKMHSLNPDSPNLNKDFINYNTISAFTADMIYQIESQCGKMNDEDKKQCEEEIKKLINADKYIKSGTEINISKNDRDRILSNVKKFAKGGHINTNEFEADRYAANRTSEKDLKSGIRNYYKIAKSDKSIKRKIDGANKSYGVKIIDKNKNSIESMRKTLNTDGVEDTKMRSKALKDTNMRNAKIYKPSSVTKESVNVIKLDIYESCRLGYITDDERDYLLEAVSTNNVISLLSNVDRLTGIEVCDLFEMKGFPKKYSELKKILTFVINNANYGDLVACVTDDPNERDFIKKYNLIPIYSIGNGDYDLFSMKNNKVYHYTHDESNSFEYIGPSMYNEYIKDKKQM